MLLVPNAPLNQSIMHHAPKCVMLHADLFTSGRTLEEICELRKQLRRSLRDAGFVGSGTGGVDAADAHAGEGLVILGSIQRRKTSAFGCSEVQVQCRNVSLAHKPDAVTRMV